MGAAATLVLTLLAFPADGFKEEGPGQPPGQPWLAKPQERRYDPVPLHGNLDVILKQLLLRADEDDDLAKLIETRKILEQALPGRPLYGSIARAGLPKGFRQAA